MNERYMYKNNYPTNARISFVSKIFFADMTHIY